MCRKHEPGTEMLERREAINRTVTKEGSRRQPLSKPEEHLTCKGAERWLLEEGGLWWVGVHREMNPIHLSICRGEGSHTQVPDRPNGATG